MEVPYPKMHYSPKVDTHLQNHPLALECEGRQKSKKDITAYSKSNRQVYKAIFSTIEEIAEKIASDRRLRSLPILQTRVI
jgi:hypothetical protein